jgi:hypothetical protein
MRVWVNTASLVRARTVHTFACRQDDIDGIHVITFRVRLRAPESSLPAGLPPSQASPVVTGVSVWGVLTAYSHGAGSDKLIRSSVTC